MIRRNALPGLAAVAALASTLSLAAAPAPALAKAKTAKAGQTVCAACVQAHVEHLASDALNGRRCATDDEAAAARYLAAELKKARVPGALPDGGYLQVVNLTAARLAAPATLSVGDAKPMTQGGEFIFNRRAQALSGPLLRLTDVAAIPASDAKGAVVFLDLATPNPKASADLTKAGAAAILTVAAPSVLEHWGEMSGRGLATTIDGAPPEAPGPSLIWLRPEAAESLRAAPTGAPVRIALRFAEPEHRQTHNVLAMIRGAAPDADKKAVLLSAHYDHLGRRDGVLFPGANDDATGTAAVLEFARLLRQGPQPKRTVVFALFGCEEEGGHGASYFNDHTPLPLADISANIEFEMIGARDPKRPDFLMLTGWERSNLGPTLAQYGARLQPDPYPEQNFFQRSDNYQLAKRGVVAQTVSAWPIPPTYHSPTDTAANIDFPFMAETIQSMVGPVRWLLDSDFTPAWNPGGKP